MHASYVDFRLRDGQEVRVSPGGIIGRLTTAELRLMDPSVSEAHAMVSQRGRELKLLALRRWFEVDGKRSSDVVLAEGQHIRLAPDVSLDVVRVAMATHVLAIEGLDLLPIELNNPVYSLVMDRDRLLLRPEFVADALGHIWSTGEAWHYRVAGEAPDKLDAGTEITIGDTTVCAVAVQVHGRPTTLHSGFLAPMTLNVRFDTVHIHTDGRPSVVLPGIAARIISELFALGGLASWTVVAKEIWRHTEEDRLLRQNWDRNMRSLRKRLREHGLRDDLVRADGKGHVELFLLEHDTVIDET